MGETPDSGGAKGYGLGESDVYIRRRHNAVAQFISTKTIMDLCLEVERQPVARVAKRLWEQDGLQLAGSQSIRG